MKIKASGLIITEEHVSVEIREVFSAERMYPDGTTRFIARVLYSFANRSIQVTFHSGMMGIDEWRVVNQAIETFSVFMSTSNLARITGHLCGLFDEIE